MAVNPAVALGGVGVVALGVVGGLYATGTGTAEVVEHKWRSLSEDKDFTSNYTSGYGKKYARYFLGINKPNDTAIDNAYWWNKKFADWNATNPKISNGKFKDVKAASGALTGNDKSLSQICDDAYKAETNKVNATVTDHANNFEEAQVWKYCSFGGTKIKTIKDASESYSSDSSYGGKEANKDDLVAAEDNNNDSWFWDLKQEELKKDSSLDSKADSVFKKLKDRLNGVVQATSTDKKTVRAVCKEAYGQTESAAGYLKADVFKFCSLSGKEPGQTQ